jgi:Holliday junction resolvasome RuvABC endonuclease subunit
MIKDLKILREEKDGSNLAFAVEPSFSLPKEMRIGIDPGTRNMGIAVLRPDKKFVNLYKIVLERDKNALSRLLEAQKVLAHTIGHFTLDSKAIIEGASYGDRFRQVELAEQRAAMLLWLHQNGIDAKLVPPLTIRKNVFGSAKIKNPWPEVDDNMVAALACALFSQDLD